MVRQVLEQDHATRHGLDTDLANQRSEHSRGPSRTRSSHCRIEVVVRPVGRLLSMTGQYAPSKRLGCVQLEITVADARVQREKNDRRVKITDERFGQKTKLEPRPVDGARVEAHHRLVIFGEHERRVGSKCVPGVHRIKLAG